MRLPPRTLGVPSKTFDELMADVRTAQNAVSAKQTEFLEAIDDRQSIDAIDLLKVELDALMALAVIAQEKLMESMRATAGLPPGPMH